MEEPDFGKGVAQLLSLTREKGSLSAAYKSMGMAASKAMKVYLHLLKSETWK